MNDEPMISCDRCGGPVDGGDGWTDGTVAYCGGMYGRGCDAAAWVWPAVAVLSAANPGFVWSGGEDVDGWHRDAPETDAVVGVWRNVTTVSGDVADVTVAVWWDAVDGAFHVECRHGDGPRDWVRRSDWVAAAVGQGAEWHVGVLPDAVRFAVRDARRLAVTP